MPLIPRRSLLNRSSIDRAAERRSVVPPRIKPRPPVTVCIAALFKLTNFKGALIEFSFDLGAPLRDAFDFSL